MQTHTTLPTYTKLDSIKMPLSDPTKSSTQSHSIDDMFRMLIETEILQQIDRLLEDNSLDPEKAGDIATQTLEDIKLGASVDELYLKAQKLKDDFAEIAPAVEKVQEIYEKVFGEPTVAHASQLVKKGEYGKAEEVIKHILKAKSRKN